MQLGGLQLATIEVVPARDAVSVASFVDVAVTSVRTSETGEIAALAVPVVQVRAAGVPAAALEMVTTVPFLSTRSALRVEVPAASSVTEVSVEPFTWMLIAVTGQTVNGSAGLRKVPTSAESVVCPGLSAVAMSVAGSTETMSPLVASQVSGPTLAVMSCVGSAVVEL